MARYVFDAAFESKFVETCKGASSMANAAVRLDMNYKTLCFHAKRLGCFKENQAGKGLTKKPARDAVAMIDIFNGTHVTYQTHKIKKRLINEGYKKHACENCGLSVWMEEFIPLELHHRNGIRSDYSLENLQLLCPNCHALTANYRAKNIKKLSAQPETTGVEPLKFGEAFAGNPEPSLS